MYAAESNAPEGLDAQAPDLRGGCVYGPGPSRNAWAAGRSACGAGRSARPMPPFRPNRPRFTALELSASCVRAGFPPAGRPGRV